MPYHGFLSLPWSTLFPWSKAASQNNSVLLLSFINEVMSDIFRIPLIRSHVLILRACCPPAKEQQVACPTVDFSLLNYFLCLYSLMAIYIATKLTKIPLNPYVSDLTLSCSSLIVLANKHDPLHLLFLPPFSSAWYVLRALSKWWRYF